MFLRITTLLATLLLAGTSPAFAQATRTWVSGVGDDANPCSRTAPCKTFAGAISKTAAGGEIDTLDPGGFGNLTITKSITIDGGGGKLGKVLSSGTNGINVNAASTDTIILRNLALINTAPAGNSVDGIKYQKAGKLIIEGLTIDGFTQSGINASLSAGETGHLTVRDTTISAASGNSATGVLVSASNLDTTIGDITATLDKVRIEGLATGISALAGKTQVIDSIINGSTTGIDAQGGVVTVEGSTLVNNNTAVNSALASETQIIDSMITGSTTGIDAQGGIVTVEDSTLVNSNMAVNTAPAATVLLSGNHLLGSTTVFGCGGKIQTSKNNRIQGGTMDKCRGMRPMITR